MIRSFDDGEEIEEESMIENSPKNLLQWEQQITPCPSSNADSMVLIKDYEECSIIFPPINHENLRITPSISKEYLPKSHTDLLTPCSSYSSSSLSTLSTEIDSESNDSTPSLVSPSVSSQPASLGSAPVLSLTQSVRPPAADVANWLSLGLGLVYSKVRGVFSSLHSSPNTAFTAAMMLGFLYFRWRRGVRRSEENRDRLLRNLREKDEKINELLHQIARMNEVLLGLQRSPEFGT